LLALGKRKKRKKNAKILKKMLAKSAPACIIDNRFESSLSSYTVLVLVGQLSS
jgi:hypothetical protein